MGFGRDRRQHPRFTQNEHVTLTPLVEGGESSDVRIVDASSSGMRLEGNVPAPSGTLIKIEGKDTLLLGEVVYCQMADAKYYLGVEVVRALYGLVELRRLNESLVSSSKSREQVTS